MALSVQEYDEKYGRHLRCRVCENDIWQVYGLWHALRWEFDGAPCLVRDHIAIASKEYLQDIAVLL